MATSQASFCGVPKRGVNRDPGRRAMSQSAIRGHMCEVRWPTPRATCHCSCKKSQLIPWGYEGLIQRWSWLVMTTNQTKQNPTHWKSVATSKKGSIGALIASPRIGLFQEPILWCEHWSIHPKIGCTVRTRKTLVSPSFRKCTHLMKCLQDWPDWKAPKRNIFLANIPRISHSAELLDSYAFHLSWIQVLYVLLGK